MLQDEGQKGQEGQEGQVPEHRVRKSRVEKLAEETRHPCLREERRIPAPFTLVCEKREEIRHPYLRNENSVLSLPPLQLQINNNWTTEAMP